MPTIKALLQETIILTFRPLISREVWAWGKIYQIFVGDYRRNWFWQDARNRKVRGKLNNLLMDLDISQWSERAAFFLGRWYELETQKLLKKVLHSGDEVVDVGANIGMFSLAARHHIGNEGTIYAFEPNPEVRRRLNRNIEINQISNITVYPVGLGETEGQFVLYVPHVNTGEGSLSCFTDHEYKRDKYWEVPVDVKIGDDLLQEVNPRLIKVDVEGAEVGVFKGISKLINRCKPLIIAEYVPQHISRFGHTFADIQSIAQEHSYNIFQLGLVKTPAGYDTSLTPVGGDVVGKACNLLLSHIEDPFIQEVRR